MTQNREVNEDLQNTSTSKGLNRGILVGVILIVVIAAGLFAYYQFSVAQVKTETVRIDVKQVMQDDVERHIFDPATITVHKGDHIVLIVTNVDEKPHGIGIPQLNLDTGPLREDQQAKLEFDATITGTFTIECSVPGCAPDHAQMLGEIVVTE